MYARDDSLGRPALGVRKSLKTPARNEKKINRPTDLYSLQGKHLYNRKQLFDLSAPILGLELYIYMGKGAISGRLCRYRKTHRETASERELCFVYIALNIYI